MARKAKARKYSAEVAGIVQAKVERQRRLLISFSVIPPSRSIPSRSIAYLKAQADAGSQQWYNKALYALLRRHM